jgi:hypothetical protein
MRQRIAVIIGTALISALLAGPLLARAPNRPAQKMDYLSDDEADKIRDARFPPDKIKLYVAFAEDRLTKFEYELGRKAQERRRTDILNGLLNGYAGCVDDATDQIALAQEKHLDIREALKLMQTKGKVFLDTLQKYDKDGPDLDTYRDTLEDAIEGTKDALSDVEDALKESQAPPVRRKQ